MAKELVTRMIGTWPVRFASRLVTPSRLRILAYHRVADPLVFGQHLDEIRRHWHPVGAQDVIESLRSGEPLPPLSVWVTFDDGYADAIEHARPLLNERGMTATMFVCPSAAAGDQPLWYDAVFDAVVAGRRPSWAPTSSALDVVIGLKKVDDQVRRARVAELDPAAGPPMATVSMLRTWADDGHTIGNHTWDHPCLDRCSPAEQHRQITSARAWLDERFLDQPKVLAYPNGNWTPEAEASAAEVGEEAALLFDHRLATVGESERFGLSRLKVDAHAPVARLRAILTGGHGVALQVATAVRRGS